MIKRLKKLDLSSYSGKRSKWSLSSTTNFNSDGASEMKVALMKKEENGPSEIVQETGRQKKGKKGCCSACIVF